jgi:capsular polysaccharide export protein
MPCARERRVLLLQGPPTPFFSVLERAFTARKVPVTRVLLHAGDRLRAGGRGIPFRGRLGEFDGWLERLMLERGITDVLYFADRIPYHRVAEAVATRLGAMPYAVENGYLRPDWLTLEPGGMGAFSRFPADRQHITRIADGAPPIDEAIHYGHSFATEAWYDVTYTLAGVAGGWRYPGFERDRPNHPVKEYVSWLPQLVRRQVARTRGPGLLQRVIAGDKPFFLFPMQLQEDYQIRHNSPYVRLADCVHEVFASFARAAPAEASLLVKIHPLDNGLENWQRTLKRIKRMHGLTGRIRMLSAGSLPQMLAHCSGVALVNSTVGIYALRAGRPTKALGVAVYDLPGLTDPQPLDGFWQTPRPPDPFYVDTFVRALARATQLKGSFYDPAGMVAGAEEIDRLQRHVRAIAATARPRACHRRARAAPGRGTGAKGRAGGAIPLILSPCGSARPRGADPRSPGRRWWRARAARDPCGP